MTDGNFYAPLGPLTRHLNRDRGTPSAADYEAAGMQLDGGGVVRGDNFVGTHDEFGITGQAFDKATGRIHKGRFLVQWTEIDGEVLHHAYKSTP